MSRETDTVMTRTYVDSSVLIAAASVTGLASPAAGVLVADPDRQFITSDFVTLEVMPKAVYHHRTDEIDLYRLYFDVVHMWVPTSPTLIQLALQRARKYGLNDMDALHIAAAELGNAEEFITAEKPTRPFFRVTTLRVVSIHP